MLITGRYKATSYVPSSYKFQQRHIIVWNERRCYGNLANTIGKKHYTYNRFYDPGDLHSYLCTTVCSDRTNAHQNFNLNIGSWLESGAHSHYYNMKEVHPQKERCISKNVSLDHWLFLYANVITKVVCSYLPASKTIGMFNSRRLCARNGGRKIRSEFNEKMQAVSTKSMISTVGRFPIWNNKENSKFFTWILNEEASSYTFCFALC